MKEKLRIPIIKIVEIDVCDNCSKQITKVNNAGEKVGNLKGSHETGEYKGRIGVWCSRKCSKEYLKN